MGASKTDLYTSQQNRIATLAKAIGHPARVAILQYLLKIQSCICGEIVNEIGLSQSTISQHLKELKSVGLIKGEVEGTKVCYCIDMQVLSELKQLLSTDFLSTIKSNTNCC